MSRRSTDSLISELSRELEPVRRIPPLRVAALGLAAAWGGGVFLSWCGGGVDLGVLRSGSLSDPLFATILAGLGEAGLGGACALLARAVPGREALARAGGWVLGTGFAVVVAAALVGWLAGGVVGSTPPVRTASCVAHAAVLGLAPALLAFLWLARAWDPRPASGAGVAGLAAAALGAFAVHASCLSGDASHVLVGHALGPPAVALGLAWAGGRWLLRRNAVA
jgi:hypothetical protein